MYFWGCRHGCWCRNNHENPCIKRGNRCVVEYTLQVDSPSAGTIADHDRFVYRGFWFSHVPRLEGADVFLAFDIPHG